MAYIYEIINDVNGKVYIGKTEFDINKRFIEHCRDAFRDRNEKRPLYKAMRKYGIEHFHVKLIEETNFPEEREIYWINKKQSFYNGYNATLGGEGKRYIDYNLIIHTYSEVLNITETAKICNISRDSVRHILNNNNIKIKSSDDILKERLQKSVGMYDKYNHTLLINTFLSSIEASEYLIKNNITTSFEIHGVSSHIIQVCNDKRSSAYGYFWRYISYS